ncbi:hypothetical protein OM416_29730 [Paenibacillus sp. LS1]|nr:hypothetical protein [Paenibacillus sp. LS1]
MTLAVSVKELHEGALLVMDIKSRFLRGPAFLYTVNGRYRVHPADFFFSNLRKWIRLKREVTIDP